MASLPPASGTRMPLQSIMNDHRPFQKPIKNRVAIRKKLHQTKFKSDDCGMRTSASLQYRLPISTKRGERRVTSGDPIQNIQDKGDEVGSDTAVKTWLRLPQSQYGIKYEVGSATTITNGAQQENGLFLLQLAIQQTPFERKMQGLKRVLETTYPDGASLVYLREFVEPSDPEFHVLSTERSVQLQELKAEQVDRLRLIIVEPKRQEILVSYLGFYQNFPLSAANQVVDHFETFKATYSRIRRIQVKFNIILGFTLALWKFKAWIALPERGWGRQKMIEGLALRWRNLLKSKTPQELGLDTEFSLPAVKSMLASFKAKVESAPTFGDPKMEFKYE